MLYNFDWLSEGSVFPPLVERSRIERYAQNAALFDGDHFSGPGFRHRNGCESPSVGVYDKCCERISSVIGNFDDIISAPVLLNYNRFISLKMADLVAGEYPTITGATDAESAKIKWIREFTNFDESLYSIVLDVSRFGDAPIRLYADESTGNFTFTLWDASGWYPIVAQDGTNRITAHCLVWLYNEQPDIDEQDDWYFNIQIHSVATPGSYEYRVYHNGSDRGRIGPLISSEIVQTGLKTCAVFNIRAFSVSGTVYGYDDYEPIDSLLAEIITRVSQISAILDKHADPSMTGPISLLNKDPVTGEFYLRRGKFYPVNENETSPEYLTWDGQLDSAFKQLEFLINQLYILSEMGAAMTGGTGESANAVSGTAMRFKLVNPLAKARRVSNSLTAPVKKLFSVIGSTIPDINDKDGEPKPGAATNLPIGHISVQWSDGIPDDPREAIENCKLATGENKLIPLEDGLITYFNKSATEARKIVAELSETQTEDAVNKPGPQDGTGVNPQKKGATGLRNFTAETNKPLEEK